MKTVPAAILFVLGYLIMSAYAGCHWDTRVVVDCPYEKVAEYTGPPGQIVQGIPTLPADVSFNQNTKGDAALDIMSSAIGTIPVVGSILGGFFDSFRTIFSQQSTNEALNNFYQALSAEVDALINYVDQKVLELQVTDIQNYLGGLERAALDCYNYYSNYANDMKTCLISVRGNMKLLEDYFIPYVSSNPSAEYAINQGPLLERLIPMWRHYCDLSLVVTLELISTMWNLGDSYEAAPLIDELPQMLTKFLDFWDNVKPILSFYSIAIQDPDTFVAKECKFWEGNDCAFKTHTYDLGHVQATFGPSGNDDRSLACSTEYYVGCKAAYSMDNAFRGSISLFEDYMSNWIEARTYQVDKYYYYQVERTTDLWEKMLHTLEAQAEQVTPKYRQPSGR